MKDTGGSLGEHCLFHLHQVSQDTFRCKDGMFFPRNHGLFVVFLECVDVVEDEEPSVGAFYHHTGPVHGLQVHGGRLYTCSGDNTARAYSLMVR